MDLDNEGVGQCRELCVDLEGVWPVSVHVDVSCLTFPCVPHADDLADLRLFQAEPGKTTQGWDLLTFLHLLFQHPRSHFESL